MNFRIFNNYKNAVMNAIDAQHNHLDEQAEITFTNNGKWALHKLEKIFKDKDQNIRRFLNGKPCVFTSDKTGKKVDISIGRNKRIAPNFILGALADATGMPGKSFGKIDIYDRFTTVEIPETESEYIIDSMTNTKINGTRIKVKLYEGKKSNDGEKDYRRLEKKQYDRRGKSDRRSKSDGRSNSAPHRRRYQ